MRTRLVALAALVLTCLASSVFAQTPAFREPHHKQLIYTNFLRAFEVDLAPGETMADHVHQFDVATLVLSDATTVTTTAGQAAAPVSATTGTVVIDEYSGKPATPISVKNTGTTRYHVIEVENVREDGKFPTVAPMQGMGVSLLKSSRGFAVYETKFAAGGSQSQHAHEKAFVIVRIDGTVENGGIGGEEPVKMTRPGQWIAMPAAANHYLGGPDGPARGIEIEVR
jgi:quercetin dioxygenase-like cupin family protein